VDKLTYGALGAKHYGLSKARAWLDLALNEYHDKDRSGIVQDAIAEAARLLDGIDANPAFDARDTPHPPASEKVRTDLWEVVDRLKANPACASRPLAELEVQLVWTGHEKWESGWDHAAPYARIAELIAHDAKQLHLRCQASAAASAPVSPAVAPAATPVLPAKAAVAPAAPAPAVVVERRTLDGGFAYASSNVGQDAAARQMLDGLATELKSWRSVNAIEVVGHADHLGAPHRVQARSLERAERVKQELVARGLAAGSITATGRGASEPLVQCDAGQADAALKACLAANRRVDILITGTR
jgi:OmpA-OmpF porin, OOP family